MSNRTSRVTLSVEDRFSQPLRSYADQMARADQATAKLGKGGQDLGRHYDTLARHSGMAGVALLGLGTAAAAGGVGLVKLGMDMEQTRLAFTTLLGDGRRAKVFLDELQDFAAQTPFQFNDLTGAARRLLALGFAAEDILPMLTDVGDAVAAMGGSSEVIDRVTLALGQMLTRGKVSAQEMMQLTEAGIPAWRYLAEGIGVTTGEVQKLTEKGLVPAEQAIELILAGMRQDFGGMMAEQAKTAAGQLSTLVDELQMAGVALGEMLVPAAKDFIGTATGAVESFNDLSTATKTAILDLGSMATGTALVSGALLLAAPKAYEMAKAYREIATALAAVRAAGGMGGALVGAAAPAAAVGGAVAGGLLLAIEVNRMYAAEMEDKVRFFQEAEVKIRESAGSWQAYEMALAQVARGLNLVVDAEGNLAAIRPKAGGSGRVIIEERIALTQAMWEAIQADHELSEAEMIRLKQGAASTQQTWQLAMAIEAQAIATEAAGGYTVDFTATTGAYADAAERAADEAARLASSEKANAEAAERAREAMAEAQASLVARAQGFYDLAAALKDTTAEELAQAQLAALNEMLERGAITQAEYKAATESMGLAFGIFTPAGLEAARVSEQLVKWFAEGRITAEELTTATSNLKDAAADGKVDIEELGITVRDRVAPEFAHARDRAEEFEGVLDRLDGRTVTTTVHTYFTSEGQAAAIEAGGGYAPDYSGPTTSPTTPTSPTIPPPYTPPGPDHGNQPFAGGGGGVVVNVSVDARGGDADEISRNIAGALRRAFQSGVAVMGG